MTSHSAKELSDLILMDINMPRPAGLEVLRVITTDKSLRAVPGGSR